MERFSRENRERFPKFLRNIAAITTTQFTLAVGVLLVLALLASYLATTPQRQVDLLTITLAIFLVHILGHVAQSVFFHCYPAGLITALIVVLPYSLDRF